MQSTILPDATALPGDIIPVDTGFIASAQIPAPRSWWLLWPGAFLAHRWLARRTVGDGLNFCLVGRRHSRQRWCGWELR